jgi:predicted ABC-type transport system involved in lysophospholipase L1 biosynthesis ATPase subunit
MSALLACEGLGFSYAGQAGDIPVLRGVNLQLAPGERVAIVGESGSGKSTLLHLAAGLERARQGRILLEGRDLGALDERERTLLRRHRLGIVYQAFHLVPTLTALENVALPLELAATCPLDERTARARAELAAVGLAERADRYPEQLSGGEQQRVAIARALVHRPALILADEPTGNLDSATGERVFHLLLERVASQHSGLLMVTHSDLLARRLDRMLRMVDGQLVDAGA